MKKRKRNELIAVIAILIVVVVGYIVWHPLQLLLLFMAFAFRVGPYS